MARIGIGLIIFLFGIKAYSQKFSFSLQYLFKNTQIQFADNLNCGDTVFVYSSKLKKEIRWQNFLPAPYLQYEFKNRTRIFADAGLSFASGTMDTHANSAYKMGSSAFHYTISHYRLGYQVPLHLGGQQYIHLNAGLTLTNFKQRDTLNFTGGGNSTDSTITVSGSQRKQLNSDFQKQMTIGPFLGASLGIVYELGPRFSICYQFGINITEWSKHTYFIDKVYTHQFGARYELFRKILSKDQYTRRYLTNISENNKYAYSWGMNVAYDLTTTVQQSGAQAYYFGDYDKNGNVFSEYLETKPEITVLPSVGFSFIKYIPVLGINWKSDISFQDVKLTYPAARLTASEGSFSDSQDNIHRYTLFTGAEKIFLRTHGPRPFVALAPGMNIFRTVKNGTLSASKFDNLSPLAFAFKTNAGVAFRQFRLGLEYVSVPGRVNNFGAYRLSGFNQCKLYLHWNFFSKLKHVEE